MVRLKVFVLTLLICGAKGEEDYENSCVKEDYRDIQNKPIDDVNEYCRNRFCVLKCCGDGMLLSNNEVCMTEQALQKKNPKYVEQIKEQHNYSKIKLYTLDGNDVKESTKQATEIEFIVRQNYTQCSHDMSAGINFYILEDGSLKAQRTDASKAWYDLPKLQYCVEYRIFFKNRTQILTMRELMTDLDGAETKSTYSLAGFLISIFFLVLTLLVYWILPDLQNLIGLIMMAYVATLIFVFVLKCVIILTNITQTQVFCKIISPMLYFCALSSFFWLNVMAFDVYLSLSRTRSSRSSSKRVVYRKFTMYGLYAWGIPLMVTAIVTILDNIDISKLAINPEPPFRDCMPIGKGVNYYLGIPSGILISINIILFIMTVFNIWKIGRAVTNNENSKKSRQNNNKLYVCLKLSLIMGVSWILELFDGNGLFVYVLLNTYNLLSGAAIFFLFVFKKNILVKLCMRFNIDNEWVRSYEPSMRSKSGTNKSSRFSKSKKNSEMKEVEMASMTNYTSNDENTAA